ncbi:MAG: 3-dehydroquinate synthase [Oligoflexia bacterium]|nr:3-dehydroquinate synthase [Oligoflexia bacterium]
MILHTIDAPTGKCRVLIGEKIVNAAAHTEAAEKIIVITDDRVADLYGAHFPCNEVIKIGQGESVKNLATMDFIYEKLLEFEADRSTFIVGIGGGLVCDVAGFAASTFMRGVKFGFVPTTLLAQVDAGIGGKNGINYRDYKNIVGVFRQPSFILSDFGVLKTLEQKEFACGMAEVIKHAMIADGELVNFLLENSETVLNLDHKALERIVNDSVRIKIAVVNRDETETGKRRILNFGHTIGHAIEKSGKYSHGECVALGMLFAARLSHKAGFLHEEVIGKLATLLKLYGLPLKFDVDKSLVIDAVKKDKKKELRNIHFVLLQDIAKPVVKKLGLKEIEEAVHDLCCDS